MEDKEYLYLSENTILREKYKINKILTERSNFSIVYLGINLKNNKEVVIKEYFPKNIVLRDMDKKTLLCKSSLSFDRYQKGMEAFIYEGEIMKKLKSKASAEFVDSFSENGTHYVVMKYHKGEDLEEHIKNQRIKSHDFFIKNVIFPLLDTIHFMHKVGYIHRDIKPSNIIMEEGEKPILIDFGSSVDIKKKEEKKIMITPGFSPIEFYSEKTVQCKASDVYSISAMLYYYFVGHIPVDATNRIIEDDILRPSEINKSIPKNLEKFIMKNLSMDMKNRDKDIKSFKKNLKMAFYLDKISEKMPLIKIMNKGV